MDGMKTAIESDTGTQLWGIYYRDREFAMVKVIHCEGCREQAQVVPSYKQFGVPRSKHGPANQRRQRHHPGTESVGGYSEATAVREK